METVVTVQVEIMVMVVVMQMVVIVVQLVREDFIQTVQIVVVIQVMG